jgi:Fe2+ transport system protein FeoA
LHPLYGLKSKGLMNLECPLTELKDGESGTITSIKAGHGREKGRRRGGRDWGLERRLADMGLTPGTRATVVKSAPFTAPSRFLSEGQDWPWAEV